ncbi:MAG: glycerol-3-phosphate cytidylyltransferase [Omnitrophica WOR_2 bacterium RIFCSPHIGHO2_02_FULL_67_20]|nr:MAG: glycerol-3-phosphate cytidylyltransferase [Omnitrophica WOR_2 bacterium RIFCSPHIGHO2_02_FULL_67_20]
MPAPAARDKIKPLRALVGVVRRANARGRRVVFTNGCFDLLHAGHVKLLEHARRQGDLLIVGLNSDRSVRALKGPGRPVFSQRDRALLLAELQSVDYVTIFNERTPQRLIERLRPDVLMKGADWRSGQIVGSDVVRRKGGRVVRFPLLKGYSTTALIQRMKKVA